MALTWGELLQELRHCDQLVAAPEHGPTIVALTVDSRSVGPGAVYLAVRGSQADGHRFVPDAARRGAGAVSVGAGGSPGLPGIRVRDGRGPAPGPGGAWFGHAERGHTIVGPTGQQ